ncbi:MAG: AraC family transcriptional regulator [Paracoccaceae bacterium]
MIHRPTGTAPHIRVATLHSLATRSRWQIESLHAGINHSFFWNSRGQGKATVSSRSRGIGPNSLLFIPAGCVHSLGLSKNTLGYALFVPDSLPVPVADRPLLIKATSIFEQGQVTAFFEQMANESTTTSAGSEHALESYATLLSIWAERRADRDEWGDQRARSKPARLIARFLDLLEREFHRHRTIAEMAAMLRVTPTHLSRVCRERLGKPASRLLTERLVLEARIRLLEGDENISAIASALGFDSPAYFSRVFRMETGLSPRQFRASSTGGTGSRLVKGTS